MKLQFDSEGRAYFVFLRVTEALLNFVALFINCRMPRMKDVLYCMLFSIQNGKTWLYFSRFFATPEKLTFSLIYVLAVILYKGRGQQQGG